MVTSLVITSPITGSPATIGTPISITATILKTTAADAGAVLVEIDLRSPTTTVGQGYISLTSIDGGVTWIGSVTPTSATFTRLLARATLTNAIQIFSAPVLVTYGGGGTVPPTTTNTLRITSPSGGASFPVINPLPVFGITTGPNITNVEVTLKDLANPLVFTYMPATPGVGGNWATWSASLQPPSQAHTFLVARATLSTSAIHVFSPGVTIAFTGTVIIPPDPPVVCGTGFHRDPLTNTCVPDDPDPGPIAGGGGSIWDKLKGILPVALQPYALPIVVGAVGLIMMRGGFGFLNRRGGGGRQERYRTYVSGVR